MSDKTVRIRDGAFVGTFNGGSIFRKTGNSSIARCNSTAARSSSASTSIVMLSNNTDHHHHDLQNEMTRRSLINLCTASAASIALFGNMELLGLHSEAIAASVTDKKKGNQLLQSYGLPQQNVPGGYGLIVTKVGNLVISFIHPSAWLINEEVDLEVDRPRLDKSRPKGKALVRAANFNKADEVGIFIDSTTATTPKDVDWKVIADIISGTLDGATDLKLLARSSLDDAREYISFKFVTVTDAAYAFDRRAVAVFTINDGKLVICAGQATSARFKKSVGEQLETSVRSLSFGTFVS
mmetsp:Transcript_2120/g.3738  ORF Transcript_2120/g.3738 Transcript_2120/m.3738 type:complete len:296 (-) Transcript_2120:1388-2275(-)